MSFSFDAPPASVRIFDAAPPIQYESIRTSNALSLPVEETPDIMHSKLSHLRGAVNFINANF